MRLIAIKLRNMMLLTQHHSFLIIKLVSLERQRKRKRERKHEFFGGNFKASNDPSALISARQPQIILFYANNQPKSNHLNDFYHWIHTNKCTYFVCVRFGLLPCFNFTLAAATLMKSFVRCAQQ